MNKQNTEKLLKDFPSLYKQYYWDKQDTCMVWGFEFSDGWFDLIYNLSKRLMEDNPECEVSQAKEKFGGMRIYLDHANEEGFKHTQDAERMSFNICEICGKKGQLYKDGWMMVRCEEHKDKRRELR